MPINFTLHPDQGYFTSEYQGSLSDSDLIGYWESFFKEHWQQGLNELADLSHSDLSGISASGVLYLAKYIEDFYKQHNIEKVKVAIFSPDDLPYGIARMYVVAAESSPERFYITRDKEKALEWLLTDAPEQ